MTRTRTDFTCVQYLIEKGTDIYARDQHGKSTFHLCCQHAGLINQIKYLFEHFNNLPLESKDNDGNTPLASAIRHYWLEKNYIEKIKFLIEKGCSTNALINGKSIPKYLLNSPSKKHELIQLLLDLKDPMMMRALLDNNYINEYKKEGFYCTAKLLKHYRKEYAINKKTFNRQIQST